MAVASYLVVGVHPSAEPKMALSACRDRPALGSRKGCFWFKSRTHSKGRRGQMVSFLSREPNDHARPVSIVLAPRLL